MAKVGTFGDFANKISKNRYFITRFKNSQTAINFH